MPLSHEARSTASYRDELQSTRDAAARVRSVLGYTTTPLPIFVYLNRRSDVTKWPTASADVIASVLRSLRDPALQAVRDEMFVWLCSVQVEAEDVEQLDVDEEEL